MSSMWKGVKYLIKYFYTCRGELRTDHLNKMTNKKYRQEIAKLHFILRIS